MKKYLVPFSIFIIAVIVIASFIRGSNASDVESLEAATGKKQEAVLIKKGELNSEGKAKLLQNVSGDFYMGNQYAPVLMIEYASLSCPHCANFHSKVVDDLIVSHVNTGKVRYIYRDFPLNKPALDASLLAMCADKNNYFNFIKILFKSQENWAFSPDYIEVLRNIAKLGGISPEKFDTCLADKEAEAKILQTKKDAIEVLEVSSTPTIFINGIEYNGKHTYAAVAKYVDSLLTTGSK